MTGRRAIFGLCMLCAMAFSAIAAQGASAVGLTAFTCAEGASGFSTEHCVPGQTGTSYGHVAITEETHAKFSNERTNATTLGREESTLKEMLGGIDVEFVASGAIEGLGALKNEVVGGEMQASGESNASGIMFSGVEVKEPAGKGCKVFEDDNGAEGTEGTVITKQIKGRTTVRKDKENGEGTAEERHSVIIEPAEAGSNLLATFYVRCTGKVPVALEGTWLVTGKLTCPTRGATIACNHNTVTEQGLLDGKGSTAGLAGKGTTTAGKFPVTEPTHAISVTTE